MNRVSFYRWLRSGGTILRYYNPDGRVPRPPNPAFHLQQKDLPNVFDFSMRWDETTWWDRLVLEVWWRLPTFTVSTGTRSILFGAHCWFLHPWFVAAAWWRLYGFPWDLRLWVAFFVHDLGYWGKAKMDDEDGENHPFFGARIMGNLFDQPNFGYHRGPVAFLCGTICDRLWGREPEGYWYRFTFYHSRFLAKRYGQRISRLCVADKLSIVLTPWWVYGPLARLSGELDKYLEAAQRGKYQTMNLRVKGGARVWHRDMQDYLRGWVAEHRDLKFDAWTPPPDRPYNDRPNPERENLK